MNWIALENAAQLQEIKEKSATRPQIIFKHSTRCSISVVAKNRLDKGDAPEGTDFYYLDLLNYRAISNEIAEMFAVHHQSPQVLLIKNGECTYEETHSGIQMDDIEEQLATA
jgi:bacillithiol system protein YtxJ